MEPVTLPEQSLSEARKASERDLASERKYDFLLSKDSQSLDYQREN